MILCEKVGSRIIHNMVTKFAEKKNGPSWT